ARRGQLIKNHKVFMAVGHDEYWSNEQRANVEAARDAGVHLAFLTGNEIFWKTRWEKSIDSSQTDWRTIASFKETKGTQNDDLNDWTGTWRDPRLSPPQDGGRPENALLGNIFSINGRRDDSLQVPSAYGKMRLWRSTPLQTMPATAAPYTFQPGTLGYEWNTVPDNGYQPAGVGQLSRTTVTMDGQYILQNHGDVYGSGTATHAITYYKAPSGALVFGAGTVQWAWGVDDEHAFQTNTPTSDVRIKQATINFLADMGVQASTLQSGLVQTTASTDTVPPVATFTSVPTGSVVGKQYTFGGAVNDLGGVVTGVEVSTDGGVRWHPATWQAGQTAWTYTYTPSASGQAQLRVRAVDDSANLSAPVASTPGVSARVCPCSLFTATDVPKVLDSADSSALELGVKWRANTDGYVRGVKFYKGPNNTGTHTGSLWSAAGARLATGTFAGETASGWQTLLFPVPVKVDAGTTYVVSYLTPTGHFSADTEYFSRSSAYLEPLTGLQTGVDGKNGVFRGGAGFPDTSSQDTNYWVDVVWAPDPGPDTRAPERASTIPAAGSASVGLRPTLSAYYDEPLNPSSLQFTLAGPGGAAVPGASSLTGNGMTAQFTPNADLAYGTAYTASIKVKDAAGNETAQYSWTFTTGAQRPAACPCTVWDDFATPDDSDAQDNQPVELGTKVRFNGKGEVRGVRFFKGVSNTGTHTGALWSSTGLLLASGTFANETASGWQTLLFTTPVTVQANTTYVVSYYAPNGHYSATQRYFLAQGATYGATRALANGVDGANGVFKYGAGGGFPSSSYNGSNYWVDVVYRNGLNGDTTPPTLNARTPAVDATNIGVNTPLSLVFSEPVDPASTQIWLTDPGGAKLAGSVSMSGDQKTVTWTPNGALKPRTRYTASVLLADVNGNAMPSAATWSFTTSTVAACPCSLFSKATEPSVTSAEDTGLYELGVRFKANTSGTVTAVKFYKSSDNTGTHTGSLWSAAGVRLATGTFTGETGSGWQTLTFAKPVVVTPGATYVASYTAPNGHYAIDHEYFQRTAADSPPLLAARNSEDTPNGVFMPGGGFPTLSYQGNNYWVDVDYQPSSDTTAPVTTGHTPLTDATAVDPSAPVTASFDEPVDLGYSEVVVTGPRGTALAGAVTRSSDQQTVVWTPSAPLAPGTRYTASVKAADAGGNLMAAPVTWSFTTGAAACPCSVFSQASVPGTPAVAEGGGYELGMRFKPTTNGSVTGVRFYKGPGNTGQHTGSVWSSTGGLLATGTFGAESAGGWQTLTFTSPLAVTAGSTYVVSYFAPNGHYALDTSFFADNTTITTGPLTAPAHSAEAANGVFNTGAGFPNTSSAGNNYWVDVLFTT
ncbi:DUF4082 domain-containing protein, partial [Actinosynnema sp. NPDC020468]|uniref:DUF4082 domain-containing protein n=1 Tax=Actinosynnema sp. NPDC020468 TaxID=3154488 RepID=UPI0033E8FF87